jgi:RimJ/RimL family protein N-acetyltransferase
MPHVHWPLFDLEVATPRITLRYIDDQLAVELAELAAAGVHDPATMPFGVPWTDAQPPALQRNMLQYYWRTRADLSPSDWSIQLAVIEAGAVVGSTGLITSGFPVTRTFETGSWLGRRHQRRGLGTELRVATLHLGFVALDALIATTGAFTDNAASLAVTRKLGYAPNGVESQVRRGTAAEILRFRMSRAHFDAHVRDDAVAITGDAGVRELLGLTRD